MASAFANLSDDFYVEGRPEFMLLQTKIKTDGNVIQGGAGLNMHNITQLTNVTANTTGTDKFLSVQEGKGVSVGLEGVITPGVNYNFAVKRIGRAPVAGDVIALTENNGLVLDQGNMTVDLPWMADTKLVVGKADQIFAFEQSRGRLGAGSVRAASNNGIKLETQVAGLDLHLGLQSLNTDYNGEINDFLNTQVSVVDTTPSIQIGMGYSFGGAAGESDKKASPYALSGISGRVNVSALSQKAKNLKRGLVTVVGTEVALTPANAVLSTGGKITGYSAGASLDFGPVEVSAGYTQGKNMGTVNILEGIETTANNVNTLADRKSKMYFANMSTETSSAMPVALSVDYGQTKVNTTTANLLAKNKYMGVTVGYPVRENFDSCLKYCKTKSTGGTTFASSATQIGVCGRISF